MIISNEAPNLSMRGTIFVVVGPSGAGKDSIIDYSRNALAGHKSYHFAQRYITRPTEACGENHLEVTPTQFLQMKKDKQFSVYWEAHGLQYGIPSTVEKHLKQQSLVIVNGSRSALPKFREKFPRLKVILINVEKDILAQRLKARGRESTEEIKLRLNREAYKIGSAYDVIKLDNSGKLSDAGERFLSILLA